MGKGINEWAREIGAWGERKGWHLPPLCETKASTIDPLTLTERITAQYEPKGVDTNAVLAKIALCHSELPEALEAVRDGKFLAYEKDGKPEGVIVELADTVIRIMHLADLLGLDLEDAIERKMAANEKRAYRHGGRLA